jgi:hypothetical protein
MLSLFQLEFMLFIFIYYLIKVYVLYIRWLCLRGHGFVLYFLLSQIIHALHMKSLPVLPLEAL